MAEDPKSEHSDATRPDKAPTVAKPRKQTWEAGPTHAEGEAISTKPSPPVGRQSGEAEPLARPSTTAGSGSGEAELSSSDDLTVTPRPDDDD